MKRRNFIFVLTMALLLTTIWGGRLQANAMRFYGARVFHCKKDVTMREKPSASSKKIRTVKYGKSVQWNYGIGKKNGFYNVTYGNKSGWIKAKYLNFSEEDGGLTWDACKVCRCKKFISLRKGQSSKSKRIAKIPKGQYVFISCTESDLSTDKYVYADYRGKKGYVDASYLDWVD